METEIYHPFTYQSICVRISRADSASSITSIRLHGCDSEVIFTRTGQSRLSAVPTSLYRPLCGYSLRLGLCRFFIFFIKYTIKEGKSQEGKYKLIFPIKVIAFCRVINRDFKAWIGCNSKGCCCLKDRWHVALLSLSKKDRSCNSV